MEKLRVGLIGTGFMGKSHALAWNSVKAVFGDVTKPDLALLCDADEVTTKKRAGEFGFAGYTTDWRALVNDPNIDVVSITTPNGMHREMAVAALNAGKHVWCEKPMALTLADAESMRDAARASGKVTMLGYNYTRNPALHHARALIESGAIGRVFHFRGWVDEDYLAAAEIPWSWRAKLKDAGLGVLGDLMCHLVSLATLVCGPIDRLIADTDIVHRQRPLADDSGQMGIVENEDIANSLVRFASGASGALLASRASWGRKNWLGFEVHGTEGTILFQQEQMNELQLFSRKVAADDTPALQGFKRILTGPAHEPYKLFCPAPGHGLGFNDLKTIECADLIRAIEGKSKAWPDFEAGCEIERVIHAFVRSQAEGRWIKLD
eukprot:gene14447-14572_t